MKEQTSGHSLDSQSQKRCPTDAIKEGGLNSEERNSLLARARLKKCMCTHLKLFSSPGENTSKDRHNSTLLLDLQVERMGKNSPIMQLF